MSYTLPQLPYGFGALEPHIDAQTMEIHHTKHHQGYTDKLNAYLTDNDSDVQDIEQLIGSVSSDTAPALRNNGGGYYNHMLFWENLSGTSTEVSSELGSAIVKDFGSLDKCLEQIKAVGAGQFGSGWVWLVSDANGELSVMSTPNQDSPLMSALYGEGHTILLAIDVWEHAYYLKYQNKRPDYLDAIMNVVNWDAASERYAVL